MRNTDVRFNISSRLFDGMRRIGCILVLVLGVTGLYINKDLTSRLSDSVFIAIMLTGTMFGGILAYGRFCDWRSSEAMQA
jgi:FtsH-binding integral membrane protein